MFRGGHGVGLGGYHPHTQTAPGADAGPIDSRPAGARYNDERGWIRCLFHEMRREGGLWGDASAMHTRRLINIQCTRGAVSKEMVDTAARGTLVTPFISLIASNFLL